MLISTAFAQTAQGPAASDPLSTMMGFAPLLVMFAVLYFIMIRPQQKKAKEHRKMLSELQKGDEVVTDGGLTARIAKVGDNYITLTIAEIKETPVDVIVQKSSVTTLLPKGTLKTL